MSESIGPQIPEHLKAKFLNTDKGQETETSETDICPNIGPELPSVGSPNKEEENGTRSSIAPPSLNSVSEGAVIDADAWMPALPPDLLLEEESKKKDTKKQKKVEEKNQHKSSKRILGPAMMPPPGFDARKEEEEEIVGPVLPKGFMAELNDDDYDLQKRIEEFEERSEKMRKNLRENDSEKKLQRGEWMLVPPEAGFLGESPDNMRSRKFSKKAYDPSKVDNSLWTETPADRQKRLLEKTSTVQERRHTKEDDEPIQYSQSDLQTAQKVQEYNEIHRSKSLLETHAETYAKSRKWEEDDVRSRPFDRERDVLGPKRMDTRKRKEIMDQARGLSTKFSHGRSGTFL